MVQVTSTSSDMTAKGLYCFNKLMEQSDRSNWKADMDTILLDLINYTPRSTSSPLPKRVPITYDDILKGIDALAVAMVPSDVGREKADAYIAGYLV